MPLKFTDLAAWDSGTANRTNDRLAIVNAADDESQQISPNQFLFGYYPNGLFIDESGFPSATNMENNNGYIFPFATDGTDFYFNSDLAIGHTNTPGARLDIRGAGTTAATVNILAKRSNDVEIFKLYDSGLVEFIGSGSIDANGYALFERWAQPSDSTYRLQWDTNQLNLTFGGNVMGRMNANGMVLGSTSLGPDSILQLDSTTRGFRNAQMTTAQFAAIGSKTEGLSAWSNNDDGILWYDGTRVVGFRYNGSVFQGYDGTNWVDLN